MAPRLFMSHPWAADELGRDTHARTRSIAAALADLGWAPWLDENEMVGNIDAAMARGIDEADAVVVCLTRKYCEKVAAAASDPRRRDNCLSEWTYANNRKKVLLPVVMEPCMRDPGAWPGGSVAMHFGGSLYADAASDEFDQVAERVDTLLRRLGVPAPEGPKPASEDAKGAGAASAVCGFMPLLIRRRSSSAETLEHRAPPPPPPPLGATASARPVRVWRRGNLHYPVQRVVQITSRH